MQVAPPARFLTLVVSLFLLAIAAVACGAQERLEEAREVVGEALESRRATTPGPKASPVGSGAQPPVGSPAPPVEVSSPVEPTAIPTPVPPTVPPTNTPVEVVPTPAPPPTPTTAPTPGPTLAPTDLPAATPAPTSVPAPGITSLFTGTDRRLRGVGWKPDGSYALVVGQGGTVLKYDNTGFIPVDSGTKLDLFSVSWKPDGSYALITGRGGWVLKYDGTSFTPVTSGGGPNLLDVAWKPDGSYAVIVGSNGYVWKYDGTTFTDLKPNWGHYSAVAFKPGGNQALIADTGTKIETFDGSSFVSVATGTISNLQDVAWKPDGSYGLAVGSGGAVLKYDATSTTGNTITVLDSGTKRQLFGVDWIWDGSRALLVGGSLPVSPGDGSETSTVLIYDGAGFQTIYFGGGDPKTLFGLGWNPDGSYALIVGNGGRALKYTPASAPIIEITGAIPGEVPAVATDPIVDQDLSAVQYTFGQGFGTSDVGQSFVPTGPDIVAVDLPICTGAQPDEIEVQIRDGAYDGPVLVAKRLTLDAPFCGYDNVVMNHIDFGGATPLVPGQTYVIRLHSVRSSDVRLFGATGNQYPDGHLFRFDRGESFVNHDLGFTTYTSGALKPAPAPVVDQSFKPTQNFIGQGFGSFDVGQSFIPKASNIVAVGLPICTGPKPDEIEVQIREGAYDGPVIASSRLVLDVPLCNFSDFVFSRVEFEKPARLTPGLPYVLRLRSVTPSDVVVFGSTNDEYADGHLFRFDRGEPVLRSDLGFTTYTTAP
ncbi:MAG: WD40 repeat domain-containing protein [Chloroflexi bacterium]|nr:WD40 repeat domain-containing protein [Chloroflexota bacterium]